MPYKVICVVVSAAINTAQKCVSLLVVCLEFDFIRVNFLIE